LGPAFSPDGGLVALDGAANEYGVVRLLDVEKGEEVARLSIPDKTRLVPHCWTADGDKLIAVGAESGMIYVWDLPAIRRQLRQLKLDWGDEPLPEPADGLPPPIKVEV